MKKIFSISALLILWTLLLSGCMTTGPIVDDLDHYKKGDTYESIREKNEEKVIEDNTQETLEDTKAIENCINSRNNDPMLYEDESVIELRNQFENIEDFCTEFVKSNPMFYNDTIGINESGEPIGQDGEIIGNSKENIEIDYGTSDVFSNEEIDEVMNLVLSTYETWSSHPQVHKMYYDSDEMSLYELNYFEESLGLKFDKCLKIYSNFYMDLNEPENTFETDNITDYSWTACKYEGGNRELVNHGFM